MDLELKIISATDLTRSNPFSKLHSYVVVSISDTIQKTPVDTENGPNPNWNHPLKFSGAGGISGDVTVRFKIRCRRSLAVDKLIGEVCVPLRSLLKSRGKPVSYQVMKASGRKNGVLTFSCRKMDFPAKVQTAGKAFSVPADVYPPAAENGCKYDVYPPPVCMRNGYPIEGGVSYGYPVHTV